MSGNRGITRRALALLLAALLAAAALTGCGEENEQVVYTFGGPSATFRDLRR